MINKTIIRDFLEQIPESLFAFIDRYDLLMTNDELIDLIIDDSWIINLFYRYYYKIELINKILDVKFFPEYAKYYDELCKIFVMYFTYNIKHINPKYCKIYNELCKIAVKYNPYYIKHINPEYCTIYDELKKGIS